MDCTHEKTALRDRYIGENRHVERYCLTCGKHLGFVRQEMTPERARLFKMPFGKHKGKTLEECPYEYVRWAGENLVDKGPITRAVQCFLDHFKEGDIQ